MAGSAAIGNLAVNLSMETAAFTSGATKAQAELRNLSGAAQGMARGLGSVGSAGRLSAFHMQNLAFQLNDVAVSLASGQAPMRVFMQQGAQIAQISAQAGVGIGGMAKAVLRLVAPFATVAAGAGLLAAAFLGVKQTADSADLKAYIDTLGLTDEQIKKLKDTTVTWGDVTKATFQVMAENAGTSSAQITSFFSKAFHGIGDFGKFAVSIILAGFGAMVKGTADLILKLPAIVGGGIAAAANLGIAALEKMVNLGIAGLNKLSSTINGVLGTSFGQVAQVSLGRVQGNFAGTMQAIGADVSGTFHRIFNQTEATFDQISARAVQLRKDNLAAQAAELRAGDAAGRGAKGHDSNAAAVKNEADQLERMRGKLDEVTNSLLRQKPLLLDAANATKGVEDAVDSAIRAFDDQIAAQERRQQQLLSFADQFGGAIAAVALGTESLRQAFADMARSIIADIIRMSVRMLVFKAISGAFGGGSASFDAGGGSYDVPGMASGGSGVFGGFGGVDQNVLSLNGSPIARVSRGEHFNVSNDNQGGMGGRLIVELRDEMLEARIAQGANVQIVRAYPAVVAGAQRAVNEQGRRSA